MKVLVPVLAAAALAAVLPACGDAAVRDVSVSPGEIDRTSWEREWAPEEMRVWRAGVSLHDSGDEGGTRGEFAPLPGAKVTLLAASPDGRLPLRVLDETVVGEDARFRLGPGPDVEWVLRVDHPGLTSGLFGNAPLIPGVFEMEVEHGLELGARPSAPFRCRVVDEDGAGVAGITVRATSLAYFEEAVTDADGAITLASPEGTVLIDIDDAEHAMAGVPLQVTTDGIAELRSPRRPPITGQVVDARTGEPLQGAVVLHSPRSEIRTFTDADGRFTLAAPRLRHLAAFGRGMGWRAVPLGAHDDELRLALSPAEVVTGRVIGPEGGPVPEARLLAVVIGHAGLMEVVPGPATDADGHFTFDWVPPPPRGATTRPIVLARRRGMGLSAGLTIPVGGLKDATLRLSGTRDVSGTLRRGADGRVGDVPGSVSWGPVGLSSTAAGILGLRTLRAWLSDEEGRFVVRGLPRGIPLRLSAAVDGAKIEWEHTGDGPADLEVEGGFSISGEIVDAAGKRLEQAAVTARALNHPRYRGLVRTAESQDGTFRLDDLPSGGYSVTAEVDGYLTAGAMAQAGDEGVRLVARRWGSVIVTTAFPDDATPERGEIQLQNLEDAAERPRVATVPGDGERRVEIDRVREGRFRLSAVAGPWRGALDEVLVADGEAVDVTVEMHRTLSLPTLLRDADGAPLSGCRIRVRRLAAGNRGVETFWTDDSGRVVVTGLEPGEWEFRVHLNERPPITERLTVVDAPPAQLVLDVPAHGGVLARLSADHAARAGDYYVILESPTGESVVAWSRGASRLASRFRFDEKGALELRGVLAGDAVLRVSGPHGEVARREIVVPSGGMLEVELP